MVADLYPAEAPEDMPGGRVPPQDVVAEQSVLGAMMMSKQAIDPASELLSGRDFYRPAHELIFETIVDLANRGEPVDALTVSQRVAAARRAWPASVAPPTCTRLVETVPNVASADYYASIVHEKAVLRRLIEVGNRISSLGWAETGELDVTRRHRAEGGHGRRLLARCRRLPRRRFAAGRHDRRDRGHPGPRRRHGRPGVGIRRPRPHHHGLPAGSDDRRSPPGPVWASRPWASTSAGRPPSGSPRRRPSSRWK